MEAIYFKDQDYYELSRLDGTFMLDGEAISVKYKDKVRVKDLKEVKRVVNERVISHYENDSRISIEEYDQRIKELTLHAYFENGSYEFDDVEDEYNFKKFVRDWKPVYIPVQKFYPVIIGKRIESCVDTGNPHIVPRTINGELTDAFIYNRFNACKEICHKKFESLNMEFRPNLTSYNTKNTRLWSYDSRNGLRHLTAFGKYPLGFKWDVDIEIGSLENLKEMYLKDKEELEAIIQEEYNYQFGTLDLDKTKLISLQENLKHLESLVKGISYNSKGYSTWKASTDVLKKSLEVIPSLFKS